MIFDPVFVMTLVVSAQSQLLESCKSTLYIYDLEWEPQDYSRVTDFCQSISAEIVEIQTRSTHQFFSKILAKHQNSKLFSVAERLALFRTVF